MKAIIISLGIIFICSCGHGNTSEGYKPDTSGLNPESGNNANIPAGDRGVPDSSIGATTNAKAPDSNATNPNIR